MVLCFIMMNIGVRCHDVGIFPPDLLAEKVAATGVRCVQLALSKALPGAPLVPEEVNIPQVSGAFQRQGLSIAVLGCYINPVHPDRNQREAALRRFEAHLRAAPLFGCSIVGTETGSCAADCSYHPDTERDATFADLVASAERLVRCAETIGSVIVGIEAVAEKHTISTPEKMARLLKEIDSPHLGVIFDPTNLVPSSGIDDMGAFLDRCFEAFGHKIVAVHAKDYRMELVDGRMIKSPSLPAGTGLLPWPDILRRLRALNREAVPILIEDIKASHIEETRRRLETFWSHLEYM
ncbi:sugar phosphate isomerase/epimerase [Treponema sp. J25]|nr:sugar phosphate isomerase/epimerase [Treponema sp. J25]